jgi:hypothetical protein
VISRVSGGAAGRGDALEALAAECTQAGGGVGASTRLGLVSSRSPHLPHGGGRPGMTGAGGGRSVRGSGMVISTVPPPGGPGYTAGMTRSNLLLSGPC